MSESESENSFESEFCLALSSFQLLEEWLKIYIEVACRKIRAALPPGTVFKYSSADFENAPLGKLLIGFKKLNGNSNLQSKLDGLVKRRNFVAHGAALEFLRLRGEGTPEVFAHRSIQKLTKLGEEAHAAFKELDDELKQILPGKGGR